MCRGATCHATTTTTTTAPATGRGALLKQELPARESSQVRLDAEAAAPSASATRQCGWGDGLLARALVGLPIIRRALSKAEEGLCVQGCSKAGPDGCGSAGARDIFPSCKGQCLGRSALPVPHRLLPPGMLLALLCACKLSPEQRLSVWQLWGSVRGEKDHAEAQAGMQQNFNESKEGKEVL